MALPPITNILQVKRTNLTYIKNVNDKLHARRYGIKEHLHTIITNMPAALKIMIFNKHNLLQGATLWL